LSKPRRCLVVGVGAIGSFLEFLLAEAEHTVSLRGSLGTCLPLPIEVWRWKALGKKTW